jgi:hypothetical protein
MRLDNVLVTQEDARNLTQIPGMIEFVKSGGSFNRATLDAWAAGHGLNPSPLIKISVFEDGQVYLHDGHHRAVSIWCAGREFLQPEEFEVRHWQYSAYTEIAFIDEEGYHGRKKGDWMGWVTPFDIATEMRLPDIKEFKDHVKDIYYKQSPQHAIHYILTNSRLYKRPREIFYLPELANKLGICNEFCKTPVATF